MILPLYSPPTPSFNYPVRSARHYYSAFPPITGSYHTGTGNLLLDEHIARGLEQTISITFLPILFLAPYLAHQYNHKSRRTTAPFPLCPHT